MEKRIIKLIESLNRIMTTWKFLVVRRTLINIFSLIVFSQLIVITILWIFGRNVTVSIVELMGLEFGAWGTMTVFYFKTRNYNTYEEKNIRKNKRIFEEGEGEGNDDKE